MKECFNCKIKKEASEFWRQTKHADGLQSWCKQCQNEKKGVVSGRRGRSRTRKSFSVSCEDCGPTSTTVFRLGKCCKCYTIARKSGWQPVRLCADCGQDINNKPANSTYCAPCSRQRKLDSQRGHDYGMTGPEYRSIVEDARMLQEGRCAICTKELDDLHYDHDHETGLFRGLLCGRCNRGIGHFFDNPQFLMNAATYLGKFTVERTAND